MPSGLFMVLYGCRDPHRFAVKREAKHAWSFVYTPRWCPQRGFRFIGFKAKLASVICCVVIVSPR